jgi:hypothetical protein
VALAPRQPSGGERAQVTVARRDIERVEQRAERR